MSASNRLVVASMDRKIRFYDLSQLSLSPSCGYLLDDTKNQCTPMCLATTTTSGLAGNSNSRSTTPTRTPSSPNTHARGDGSIPTTELLVIGNDNGSLNVYTTSRDWQSCDDNSTMTIPTHGFSSHATFNKHT